MKTQASFFFIPLLLLGLLGSAVAVTPTEKAIGLLSETVTHKTVDLSSIEKGSAIERLSVSVSMFPKDGLCNIVLIDETLRRIPLSDAFQCVGTNTVSLTERGLDAIEYNIQNSKTGMGIGFVGDPVTLVPFDINAIDVSYQVPTYFAHVENGNVTEVIVADQPFANSLKGQWVQILKENYAGIGWTYDGLKFTPPKPYSSWLLQNGSWVPPIQYPADGRGYHWSEQENTWVLTP